MNASKFSRGKIILLKTTSSKYIKTNTEVVKSMLSKKYRGIYVTVNRTCSDLAEDFKKKKINISELFFIDMISGEKKRSDNSHCINISSPQSLTGAGIAIESVAVEIPGNKFLYIDSLSTLLTYNDKSVVLKFAHFISTKVKTWNNARA